MHKFLAFLTLGVLCLAQTGRVSGIDKSGLDTTCKPCDNFWQYANGEYMKKHPMPAQYSRWGTFPILRDANAERIKVLLETAATNKAATGNEKVVGDFYAACMNTPAIDKAGAKPLMPELQRITALQNRKDLVTELVALEKQGDVNPDRVGGQPDLDNASMTITGIGNGGLSLPERDYYFRDDDRSKTIRTEFLNYSASIFKLLGDSPEVAAAEAAKVLEFETVLANVTMTNVESRDPYKRFHKMDFAGLKQLAPDYDWDAAFKTLGVPETVAINVSQPEFLKTFDAQLKSAPLDTWKIWLRWRLANDRAQLLSQPFYNAWFHFERGVLTGVTEQQPRWQVCGAAADARLGDALGKLFVEKHFPPAARQRMAELVENLRASLKDTLQDADWLELKTREQAIRKLNAFDARIGYPDKWRDFAKVNVNRDDYEGTVESAMAENRRYSLARIGQKVDRTEMRMTPPTVNASYSPPTNIITFPAGILQPPFFNMEADDAVNYGAIGAVIGHEMGHGFDDQGSKYDADGNLKNWWTDQDRAKFEVRAGCVTNEFDSFDVGNGLHHKGKLVTGEAMGDLGGLTLAYKAYHKSLNGKEAPVMDGFTGDQRFFLAYARVWADQSRPEQERLQLNTDPHPLSRFRANGTLQNMPEFHAAFGCREGDAMVRPAAQRCKLW
jgi:putative endopeptidase